MAKKYNLCFKRSKCNFDTKEIPILGIVVRLGEVLMENNKTKTVKKWKTPINIKEVESFLEFANFYRCFIKNFSHIVKPLNELKCKKDWKYEEKYQKAFNKLKEKITIQLVHALSKREEKFRVETDILEHTIEGVLFQEQEGK